ncbi:motility protein A [Candidatus Aerophobetes bacterium]|uniref:Motility protein A n=1 Tax=Aerophobetes bacterium TaxID=2030807 RepID=A0A662D9Q8_UNCAE|nr:MAG: motility protein A [Candidatus Aerophobetes bacterium]
MDIATIGGLGIGFFVLIVGIVIAGGVGGLFSFISISSMFITVGGSFAAIMVSNTLPKTLGLMKVAMNAIRTKPLEAGRIISMIVTFSEKARREGLLALEDDLDELEDDFLRKGIQLVVDGTDPEIIRNIMETELNNMQARHQEGIKIFEDWGALAPAFGMIGTLIGLILMLANIEDKSAIGPGMSTALITTLYGAILANLVFIPIANKLSYVNNQEILMREIMIEGTLSIQSGDNPRIVKEKLISFLPPEIRAQVEEESEGE